MKGQGLSAWGKPRSSTDSWAARTPRDNYKSVQVKCHYRNKTLSLAMSLIFEADLFRSGVLNYFFVTWAPLRAWWNLRVSSQKNVFSRIRWRL